RHCSTMARRVDRGRTPPGGLAPPGSLGGPPEAIDVTLHRREAARRSLVYRHSNMRLRPASPSSPRRPTFASGAPAVLALRAAVVLALASGVSGLGCRNPSAAGPSGAMSA